MECWTWTTPMLWSIIAITITACIGIIIATVHAIRMNKINASYKHEVFKMLLTNLNDSLSSGKITSSEHTLLFQYTVSRFRKRWGDDY